MTDLQLYFKGYRRLGTEDDDDMRVWVKVVDENAVNTKATNLQTLRLFISLWHNDDNDFPVVEETMFGKAVFRNEKHAFALDYDSSWSVEDLEQHALHIGQETSSMLGIS